MSAPQNLTRVEYSRSSMKKTGTTEQALLTNHKPEPHVRSCPSETSTLAKPITICCYSLVSFSGWLVIFLGCHWKSERQSID
uniref:Uncharacterized protein n=1 Tax=Mesocestoides corti TaxID=53468 RepID=A0A5K3EY89_MESCO